MGVGKDCRDMGTKRKQLSEYFNMLEVEDEYIPLKTQYKRMTAQAKNTNSNTEEDHDESDREDMDYMVEMSNLAKSDDKSPVKNDPTDNKTREETLKKDTETPSKEKLTKNKKIDT